jgi:ribosomal protein L37AE/L43A
MPKKKPVIEKPEEVEEEQEEQVTCPVCGKPVGLEVTECPYCGAEFEEEEIEELVEVEQKKPAAPAKAKAVVEEPVEEVPVEEEEMAECPVCGKMVGLSVSSCPNCGAEFEEEEVEEVIEVEERQVPAAAVQRPAAPRKLEVEPEEETEVEASETRIPSGLLDLRVIGIALISFMIDWYWTWVPPIKDNLGMFVALPAVVIVVALFVYLLVKRALGEGRKVPFQMPELSMSLFLFGILALIVVMLWSPINKALQSSSAGVGGAFVILLVAGIALIFLKMRAASRATA